MPTSASSAPGTPGSPPPAGWRRAGKSVVVLEARDRVGGRIWTQQLDERRRPSTAAAAGWRPKHDAVFALAAEMGVTTYKTYVAGRAPARRRRPHPPLHGPHPEDQPARGRSRSPGRSGRSTGWRSRCRSRRRGRPPRRPSGTPRSVGDVARDHRHPHRDRPRPVRDGGPRPAHRRPRRRVAAPPADARARARQPRHAVLDRGRRAGEPRRRRRRARWRSGWPTSSSTPSA